MKCLGAGLLLLAASNVMCGPAYPLKLAPGKHYLVDQNNNPFFIQGDSAWSLIANLPAPDVDLYLSNRAGYGYNSIIVNLIESTFATNAPKNFYGSRPFLSFLQGSYTGYGYWDWTTIDTNYFTNADNVINRAAAYGINVILFPAYLGYNGDGTEGWYPQLEANGTNVIFNYGQFVGNRYKNFTNIIWALGGDYTAPDMTMINWLASGIALTDTNHMVITSGPGRGTNSMDVYTASWDVLNAVYPPDPTYPQSLRAYGRSPVAPMFLIEAYYEGTAPEGQWPNGKNALQCRQSAYGNVFSGSTGHVFGNEFVWSFGDVLSNDWKGNLNSPGAISITNVLKLVNTRPWYNCVPDTNHSVVISGYGTNGNMDYVSCMREAAGKTIMAYIPQDTMTPTVDMTKISGLTANAWWFNPRTGAATAIGTYTTSGSRTFTPTDTNDWVLVLDDASQNYSPPGAPGKLSLGFQPLGGNTYKLTVAGIPGQAFVLQSATNLSNSWQTLGNGMTDNAGTFVTNVTATSAASFFRSLDQ